MPAELPLLVTGVGKTLAAVQVTRTLATHPRRDRLTVVNIGTAGALRDGLSGTFEIGTVLNHDLSAEPIRRLGLDPRERIVLDASLPTTLASGDLFVTEAADRDRLSIRFGGIEVAREGAVVDGYDEAPVATHLKGREVLVEADLGLGSGRAVVWTCDLTHGYISINADYRS